ARRRRRKVARRAAEERSDRVASFRYFAVVDLEHAIRREQRREVVEAAGVSRERISGDGLANRFPRGQLPQLHGADRTQARRALAARRRPGKSGRAGGRVESYTSTRVVVGTTRRGEGVVRSSSKAVRTSPNAAGSPP